VDLLRTEAGELCLETAMKNNRKMIKKEKKEEIVNLRLGER